MSNKAFDMIGGTFLPLSRIEFGAFYDKPVGTLILPQHGRTGDLAILAEHDGTKLLLLLGGEMRGKGFQLTPDDPSDLGQIIIGSEIEADPASLTPQFGQGALILQQGGLAIGYVGGMLDLPGHAFIRSPTEQRDFSRRILAYSRWRIVLRQEGELTELYRYDAGAELKP